MRHAEFHRSKPQFHRAHQLLNRKLPNQCYPQLESAFGGAVGVNSEGSVQGKKTARAQRSTQCTAWMNVEDPLQFKGEIGCNMTTIPSCLAPTWKLLLLSDGSVTRHLKLLTGMDVHVDCQEMRVIEQDEIIKDHMRYAKNQPSTSQAPSSSQQQQPSATPPPPPQQSSIPPSSKAYPTASPIHSSNSTSDQVDCYYQGHVSNGAPPGGASLGRGGASSGGGGGTSSGRGGGGGGVRTMVENRGGYSTVTVTQVAEAAVQEGGSCAAAARSTISSTMGRARSSTIEEGAELGGVDDVAKHVIKEVQYSDTVETAIQQDAQGQGVQPRGIQPQYKDNEPTPKSPKTPEKPLKNPKNSQDAGYSFNKQEQGDTDAGYSFKIPVEVGMLEGPLLQRQVLLKDRQHGGDAYVYATSWWNQKEAEVYLKDKTKPIWTSLAQGHMELYRDIQWIYQGHQDELEAQFGCKGPFWARQYFFWHNNKPLVCIYEVFSPKLEKYLGPMYVEGYDGDEGL